MKEPARHQNRLIMQDTVVRLLRSPYDVRVAVRTQAVIQGKNHELNTVVHAEFVINAREMVLHCELADAERARDILIGLSIYDGVDDLQFTRRETEAGGIGFQHTSRRNRGYLDRWYHRLLILLEINRGRVVG